MDYHRRPDHLFTVLFILLFIISCSNNGTSPVSKKNKIVENPGDMNSTVEDVIKETIETAIQNDGKIDDTIRLALAQVVQVFYQDQDHSPVWSSKAKWKPLADSLYQFIEKAEYEGLFPKDYHFKNLKSLKNRLDTDSVKRMDAVLWGKADLMLTDGFMRIIRDLKQGRIAPDSISAIKDTLLADKFFSATLKQVLKNKNIYTVFNELQPKLKGYWELKRAIRTFVDSMERSEFTYVAYPFKKGDADDSVYFIKKLMKRLGESGCATVRGKLPDSLELSNSIKKFQQKQGLTADGKYSAGLIKTMNIKDAERFMSIAITLDRYKQLPDTMPEKYVYVNLPSYTLHVWDHDTLALESKIICGRASTRTPVLTSEISDMVTYPTWTVPNSIIVKNYLPKLKKNPNYLTRIGLKLVGGSGKTIDPGRVKWSRYSKGIPFRVMQNSGDNNALGVLKFNFSNPYQVYLHDTNERGLFRNNFRALSHGCVRVQQWNKLAYYIARNDSLNLQPTDTLKYTTDSIRNWLSAKDNRRIEVKNKIPLFIRYFTCEGVDGKVKFYEDIYGEDRIISKKYFGVN